MTDETGGRRATDDELTAKQRILRRLLRRLPQKRGLVALGARTPSSLKGVRLTRLLAHLYAEASLPAWHLLETNLGLGDDLRVLVPAWAGTPYLFGTPGQLYGEEPTLRLCAALMRGCSTFVDVGCHLGYFLWYLRPLLEPPKRALAVEPHPQLFELLERNALANRVSARLIRTALGDRTGRATFYADETELSMSTTADGRVASHRYRHLTVPITTAAAVFEEEGVVDALVKVDIEGAENEFVAGLAGAQERVRYLVMEVLPPALAQGVVETTCRALDMRVAHLEGAGLRLAPPWGGGEHDRNWLFYRESSADLKPIARAAGLEI